MFSISVLSTENQPITGESLHKESARRKACQCHGVHLCSYGNKYISWLLPINKRDVILQGNITLVAIIGAIFIVPYIWVMSLQLIWSSASEDFLSLGAWSSLEFQNVNCKAGLQSSPAMPNRATCPIVLEWKFKLMSFSASVLRCDWLHQLPKCN